MTEWVLISVPCTDGRVTIAPTYASLPREARGASWAEDAVRLTSTFAMLARPTALVPCLGFAARGSRSSIVSAVHSDERTA